MKINKINTIINIIGLIIFGLGGYMLISFTTFNRLELLIVGIISSITGISLCGLQVIEMEKK